MTNTGHTTNGQGAQGLTFLSGVIAGALIGGAAVGMLSTSRARSVLHGVWDQAAGSAAKLRRGAADRYRRTSTQVGDAVEHLHDKGLGAYGDALTAVARGAHRVEEYAAEARTASIRTPEAGSSPVDPGGV